MEGDPDAEGNLVAHDDRGEGILAIHLRCGFGKAETSEDDRDAHVALGEGVAVTGVEAVDGGGVGEKDAHDAGGAAVEHEAGGEDAAHVPGGMAAADCGDGHGRAAGGDGERVEKQGQRLVVDGGWDAGEGQTVNERPERLRSRCPFDRPGMVRRP